MKSNQVCRFLDNMTKINTEYNLVTGEGETENSAHSAAFHDDVIK